MSQKAHIRKRILELRRALTLETVQQKSARILENLKPMIQTGRSENVHLFLSIEKFREIDTRPIISFLGNRKLAVPRVNSATKMLTHHEYVESDLVESKWGILEPSAEAPELSPQLFDLILVPMLAFDLQGHRVGYGAGFYDKFLAQIRPDCLKVGLCFELGKVKDGVPVEAFDVPLNWIVTEETVYEIPKSQ